MPVSDVINPNAVVFNLEASEKTQVLRNLAELLYRDGSINNRDAFLKDLLQREQEGKTGIGGGIAIPHAKSDAVNRTCIAIAKLKTPILWETIDGLPVQIVILFAVNRKDQNSYFVKLMSQVARLLVQEDFCRALFSAADKDDLLEIWNQTEKE